MLEQINTIIRNFERECAEVTAVSAVEPLKIKYLGRKGLVSDLFKQLGTVAAAERGTVGKALNQLKSRIGEELEQKERQLTQSVAGTERSAFDVSLPAIKPRQGKLHPLTVVINELCSVFVEMGFLVAEGPEIETEYYNFEALNIPLDHPARDGFDTFYLLDKWLLRSHTSPVQVRQMEQRRPPIQIVVPGKVYRPDATDARHSFMFHQVEGLLIDENVSFAHLKGVLDVFIKKLCGEQTRLRFRPSFFPFTEPSAEIDITCIICKGSGCRVCGTSGWLEVLGAGMVHPNVLRAGGIDSARYSGFAFGVGVERIAMLKYGIDDIRLFFENDVRFTRQFS